MKKWKFILAGLALFGLASQAQGSDTYTPACRIVQMANGSNDTQWGTKANAAFAMLEKCATGSTAVDVTSGNVTLTVANNADDQARNALIVVTGTPGTPRIITLPNVAKVMTVANASNSSVTITAGAGLTVTLGVNHGGTIYTDGATNVAQLFPDANVSAPIGTIPIANLPVGTTTGTVAAGNDSRIVGAAQKSANLSDLTNIVVAQTSLGLIPSPVVAAETNWNGAGVYQSTAWNAGAQLATINRNNAVVGDYQFTVNNPSAANGHSAIAFGTDGSGHSLHGYSNNSISSGAGEVLLYDQFGTLRDPVRLTIIVP